MSIHVLQGVPGAGKSYNAVQRAAEAVDSGRVVITNLPLKTTCDKWALAIDAGLLIMYPGPTQIMMEDIQSPHLGNRDGWEPIFDGEGRFARTIHKDEEETLVGPLVIVDEASSTFSDMWRNNRGRHANKTTWEWLIDRFKVHRHFGADILLIYQDYSQILPDIKGLVERYHNFTNTSDMTRPVNTWSMKTTKRGWAITSSSAIETSKGVFKSDIFALYDSHNEGAGKGHKVETKGKGVLRVRPLWLRPSFLIFVGCLFALPFLVWRAWGSAAHLLNSNKEITQAPVVAEPTLPATANLRPPLVTTEIRQSTTVAGVPLDAAIFVGFGKDMVFMADGRALRYDQDLRPEGWRVMSAQACRLVIVRDIPPEVRTWTCAKGY